MDWLLEEVRQFINTYGLQRTYWIAYSGGMDSHVLLHLCVQLRQHLPMNLRAVHVDHGLSPHSSQWAEHCAKRCAEINVEYVQQKITITLQPGQSLEEIAREYRYRVFMQLLSASDCLLTAHHQDDQAETLLLQLLRGAGPKGLAAMPPIKPFAHAEQGRPLLNATRVKLMQYAERNQLQWVSDESNDNMQLTRNFLRQAIMPLLNQRWPNASKIIARSAAHCAETQMALEHYLAMDLQQVRLASHILSLKKLRTFSPVQQRQILRYWLASCGVVVPNATKLQQMQQDFLQARQDKAPRAKWKNVELRRYQDKLYLITDQHAHGSLWEAEWDLEGPLALPNRRQQLQATVCQGQGLHLDYQMVTVRFRRGGERCRLPGREFHHDLKKLFQFWQVPPWERDRVPLLFIQEQLIAVVGHYIDAAFAAKPGEWGRAFSLSITAA